MRPVKLLILFFLLPFVLRGQIITTAAGNGTGGYTGDGGPAVAAGISWFGGLAVDSHGNLYIADGNHQCVRKVNATTGIITTFAGTGIAGYNGDNILATNAELKNPGWVAVDANDNVYISDNGNYRIRRVDIATSTITTYAGTGISGYNGDGIPANTAQIKGLQDLTVDPFGNLYFVDGQNYRIRKIDVSGLVSTVAGNGIKDVTGNGGQATAASVSTPLGIGTDKYGNVYFNDSPANVRKINVSNGIITRVVGTETGMPFNGDEIPALSANVGTFDIAFDTVDNMYLADFDNNRIRKVDTDGFIHTIAGNGTGSFGGDGGPADSAEIHGPEGVVVDQCGNVYIADFGNKRVRKVTYHPMCSPTAVADISRPNAVIIYPNPAQNEISITGTINTKDIAIINAIGQMVLRQNCDGNSAVLNLQGLQSGVYFVVLRAVNGEKIVKKIIKE